LWHDSKFLIAEKGESEMKFSRWGREVPLCAAAAMLACAFAMAQTPGDGQMPQNQQSPTPGQQNGAYSPGGNMSSMPDNPAPAMADQSFVRKVLEDDLAQVQIGQLAAQKSPSDDIKQFGQKMAQIHAQLSDQLKPVAQKLGVSEPRGPSKKDKQEIERMQTLSGADFDAAFIKAMLKYQQTDLKNFKDEAQGGQDPNLQQVAKVDEPVLSQHLQILEQLAQTHNVPVESK
jgi:putative membrane protein